MQVHRTTRTALLTQTADTPTVLSVGLRVAVIRRPIMSEHVIRQQLGTTTSTTTPLLTKLRQRTPITLTAPTPLQTNALPPTTMLLTIGVPMTKVPLQRIRTMQLPLNTTQLPIGRTMRGPMKANQHSKPHQKMPTCAFHRNVLYVAVETRTLRTQLTTLASKALSSETVRAVETQQPTAGP